MMAMKKKLIIIAVLVILLIASYILCDTKQNDAGIFNKCRWYLPVDTDIQRKAERAGKVKRYLPSA